MGTVLGRIVLAFATIASAYASWIGRPSASPRHTDVHVIQARAAPLAVAFAELAAAMERHGCTDCHTPDPVQLFDDRRAIEEVIDAKRMPPATNVQPAGIADASARADLLRVARRFRELGDASIRNSLFGATDAAGFLMGAP